MKTIFLGFDYQLQPDKQKEQRPENKPEIKINDYNACAFQQSYQAKSKKNKTEYYTYHNF